jgi:hypothetical protein
MAGLTVSAVLAGCAAPSSTPALGQPTPVTLPTVPDAEEPTPVNVPTSDPALGGLPADLSGYELAAARAGTAVYSGYNCTIAPVGCACEAPVILRVTFTFTTDGHLNYQFAGDGFAAEWFMNRLGPDRWEHTFQFVYEVEDGSAVGAIFAFLEFTSDGYILTQGANLDAEGIVTCPEINFRRLGAQSP